MTTMVRVVIDLPACTNLSALQKLADEAQGKLFRRPDGTFVVRSTNPADRPQAVPA
jgi:hypothetical protein